MKIGIDPGKWSGKAVTKVDGEWKYFNVRSKISQNATEAMGGNNYLVEFDNQKYLIGEGADDYSLDTDKQTIQHKLLTYLSINQLSNSEPIEAVVGIPFNLFKSPKKREEYVSYMKDREIVEFNVNEESSIVAISELVAFPECGGIAYSEPDEDFVDNTRAVLDIGGLNINGCVFNNISPEKDSIVTDNLGSIILMDDIKSELNKEFSLNLQDYDMPKILKNGLMIDNKKINEADKFIDGVIEEHFSKIIKALKKKNWSIKTLDITCGGGGSLDISLPIIQKFIKQAKICNDPVWGNAKGNYIVAEMLFG